ncbi:hypothetical protein U1Q18_044873 [Sarracenia purpurea var. burkii]
MFFMDYVSLDLDEAEDSLDCTTKELSSSASNIGGFVEKAVSAPDGDGAERDKVGSDFLESDGPGNDEVEESKTRCRSPKASEDEKHAEICTEDGAKQVFTPFDQVKCSVSEVNNVGPKIVSNLDCLQSLEGSVVDDLDPTKLYEDRIFMLDEKHEVMGYAPKVFDGLPKPNKQGNVAGGTSDEEEASPDDLQGSATIVNQALYSDFPAIDVDGDLKVSPGLDACPSDSGAFSPPIVSSSSGIAEVALTRVRGAANGAKKEEDRNKGPAGKMNIQVETEAKPSYAISTKKENVESKEDALPSSGGSSPFLSEGLEYVDKVKIKEVEVKSSDKEVRYSENKMEDTVDTKTEVSNEVGLDEVESEEEGSDRGSEEADSGEEFSEEEGNLCSVAEEDSDVDGAEDVSPACPPIADPKGNEEEESFEVNSLVSEFEVKPHVSDYGVKPPVLEFFEPSIVLPNVSYDLEKCGFIVDQNSVIKGN